MGFRRINRSSGSAKSPELLFRDLKTRDGKYRFLWAHQQDILREYYAHHLDSSNVALELPTGSGKTLIGLMIAEYRRQSPDTRVAYLCPTRQLCHQVHEQAAELGIPAVVLVGRQAAYDPIDWGDYVTGKSVAITTYSSVFNVNPRIKESTHLIVDDAHAAENYFADMWTVEIRRHEHQSLYSQVLELLADGVPEHTISRLRDDDPRPEDHSFVDAVPFPTLKQYESRLSELIDSRLESDEAYSWSTIKEHLTACHVFLQWAGITIRPYIPPTLTHSPFKYASQRVFMSATLGRGGELERSLGVPRIERIPIPEGWDRQGSGRKFIVFPHRSLDDEQAEEFLGDVLSLTPRSLGLSPSRVEAQELASKVSELLPSAVIFHASDVEDTITRFTSATQAHLGLSGRYDGIDLPDDDCRLVILNGLPGAINALERFLLVRLAAESTLRERIRTRFTQAVGRCSRSDSDFSLVICLGVDVLSYLGTAQFHRLLHPELRAEVLFGLENSIVEHPEQLVNLASAFLDQSEEWKAVEGDIITTRDEVELYDSDTAQVLESVVADEVKYSYYLWSGQYEAALEQARGICDELGGASLNAYRSWWNYLAGSAALLCTGAGTNELYYQTARELFERAAISSSSVRWFSDIARSLAPAESKAAPGSLDAWQIEQTENLRSVLRRLGVMGRRFDRAVAETEALLDNDDASRFERGIEKLGSLLGFRSVRPEGDAAPDGYWLIEGRILFAFEAKSEQVGEVEDPIPITDVKQAAGHLRWGEAHGYSAHEASRVVLISSRTGVNEKNSVYGTGVCVISVEDFRKWAKEGLGFLARVRAHTSETGLIESPQPVASKLQAEPQWTVEGISAVLTKHSLTSE